MRKIIHVDMDAFYASIEQRNNPELRGKPVIVSGPPQSRSVVSTCSYEARQFGIHSAMPSIQAYRLCPHGHFVPPHFSEYKEASREIHRVFLEFTDLIEPLSLDEAYLDVTDNKSGFRSSTLIAKEIKAKIKKRTDLTSSAGISYNKFLAKIASDWQKPDGMTLITPSQALPFLERLPIGKFYGIGSKTEETLIRHGIKKGKDLLTYEKWELIELFGKSGAYYYHVVRGIDNRPVVSTRERKSMGKEETFSRDILSKEDVIEELKNLSHSLENEMTKKQEAGRTVTLKIKYNDFSQVTRSTTLAHPIYKTHDLMKHIYMLLDKTRVGIVPIRLAGISVSQLKGEDKREAQLDLF